MFSCWQVLALAAFHLESAVTTPARAASDQVSKLASKNPLYVQCIAPSSSVELSPKLLLIQGKLKSHKTKAACAQLREIP